MALALAGLIGFATRSWAKAPPGSMVYRIPGGKVRGMKLTHRGLAGYADMVRGPRGRLYGLYTQGRPTRVYFVESTDGGATWSRPVDLWPRQTNQQRVDTIQLAFDGRGRLYAFWKVIPPIEAETLADQYHKGPLYMRVLANGAWGRRVDIEPHHRVVSWYVAPDAQGRLHVVWSQPPGAQFMVVRASEVNQAIVTPAGVGPVTTVIPPNQGTTLKQDHYYGLRGLMGVDGRPQFVAFKQLANRQATELIYWNGRRQTAYATASQLGRNGGAVLSNNPPELVALGGREHVIAMIDKPGPALIDIPVGVRGVKTIMRLRGAGAAQQTFSVSENRNGLLVLYGASQGGLGAQEDLYAITNTGRGWSAPRNLTHNSTGGMSVFARNASAVSATSIVRNLPQYASGVLTPRGKLLVLMVSVSKKYVDASAQRLPDNVITTEVSGIASKADVYFLHS